MTVKPYTWLLMVLLLLGTWGCTKPTPVSVIFLLDSSASSAPYRQPSIEIISKIAQHLIPQVKDQLTVLRVGQDVYSLYSGAPNPSKLMSALDEYSHIKPADYGTAYGAAFERAIEEVQIATKKNPKTLSAIIVMGDGADERVEKGGNIDWERLPTQLGKLPKSTILAFLYIDPEPGDRYGQSLRAVFGDRLIIVPAALVGKKTTPNLLQMMKR